jgi:hypothetical protein
MTNRDMLDEFAQIFHTLKDQHDISDVPLSVPLVPILSPELNTWFCKYFRRQSHILWLEARCHLKLGRIKHGVRYLEITHKSCVDLVDTALLTGLDDFYSHQPAFVSSASMPSAAIAAAPPVIHDCPPSPSIAHQPAASVAPCASQPVTNLAMLAHFAGVQEAEKVVISTRICSSSACDELR